MGHVSYSIQMMSGVKMVILQPKVPYVQLSNVRFSEPHCTGQVRYLDLVYTLFTLVASLKRVLPEIKHFNVAIVVA